MNLAMGVSKIKMLFLNHGTFKCRFDDRNVTIYPECFKVYSEYYSDFFPVAVVKANSRTQTTKRRLSVIS